MDDAFELINAEFLTGFFDELREKEHPVYALLYGMPLEDFCILHVYNYAEECETYRQPGHILTLPEFLEKAPTFDPRDDFSLCFYHVGEAEEGETPKTELDIHGAVTLREIRELFAEFLFRYCEKRLREDAPFRLTDEVIARCGLTAEDVAKLDGRIGQLNALAAARLQAEYDALKELSCIVR